VSAHSPGRECSDEELAGIAEALGPRHVILDGELVCFCAGGKPDFERFRARLRPVGDAVGPDPTSVGAGLRRSASSSSMSCTSPSAAVTGKRSASRRTRSTDSTRPRIMIPRDFRWPIGHHGPVERVVGHNGVALARCGLVAPDRGGAGFESPRWASYEVP
jgi:hypothetical protein